MKNTLGTGIPRGDAVGGIDGDDRIASILDKILEKTFRRGDLAVQPRVVHRQRDGVQQHAQ